ncbi:Uncharacterised protein [Streptococcus pneumoniae]|nr:Uncharacterised protein [Streptococcus pneumoniae]CNA27870.1 Uncharacterised protein [Streptococcus pneumoniae]
MTIQVLHTVTWQDKSSHLFVAFCWVQFLEITSRHINHCADSIDLIMQACVNDSKEIVTLSLIRSNFTLPLVEQVTFNKVSYLVDLGKTRFHLAVNFVHATATDTIMWRVLQKCFPSIGQLVLVVVSTSDNSQGFYHLL